MFVKPLTVRIKMKRRYFCLVFFLSITILSGIGRASSFSRPCYCQNSGDDEEKKKQEQRDKWNKALGSFQFQVLGRTYPSIDIAIIEKIEMARHKTDTVFMPYSQDIRIMILPESVIKGEYKKLDHIRHLSSN